MRFALATILSFVVLAVTKSQDLPLDGSSPYYPLYNLGGSVGPSFQQRFLIQVVTSLKTSFTSTSTTTSITTCTVSTSQTCTGRRRRGIEWAESEESIAPSAVSPYVGPTIPNNKLPHHLIFIHFKMQRWSDTSCGARVDPHGPRSEPSILRALFLSSFRLLPASTAVSSSSQHWRTLFLQLSWLPVLLPERSLRP